MFWGEIGESEKVGSEWEMNPGYLACIASVPSLSYDNQTTGQLPAPHNHRWHHGWATEAAQSHLCSTYSSRIVRAGGCPAVVAQWQSTSWYPGVQFPVTAGFFFSLSFISSQIFLYSTSKAALKPLYTHLGLHHYALSLTKWFDKEPKLFPQS